MTDGHPTTAKTVLTHSIAWWWFFPIRKSDPKAVSQMPHSASHNGLHK